MKFLLILAAAAQLTAQSPTSLTLQTGAPTPPVGVNAAAAGTLGRTPLYYWVVARMPAGVTSPSAVATAPYTLGAGNLSVSNYVAISWPAVTGATGYDVVRSSTPVYPVPCATSGCAVILNTTSTTVNDVGTALIVYSGSPAIPPASATFTINNVTDSTGPFINVQLVGQAIEQLRLGLITGTPTSGNCIMYSGGRLADAGAPCGTGGGGGSSNLAAPPTVTVTSATVLTISSGKWTTANAPQWTTAGGTATISGTPGTGTCLVFGDAAGSVVVQCPNSGLITTVCSGCSFQSVPVPAISTGAVQLASVTFSAAGWGTKTNTGSQMINGGVTGGRGILVTGTGLQNVATDPAMIPDITAPNTWYADQTFAHQAAPSTPSAGYSVAYYKTGTGTFCYKTPAGVETCPTAGGGSSSAEYNYYLVRCNSIVATANIPLEAFGTQNVYCGSSVTGPGTPPTIPLGLYTLQTAGDYVGIRILTPTTWTAAAASVTVSATVYNIDGAPAVGSWNLAVSLACMGPGGTIAWGAATVVNMTPPAVNKWVSMSATPALPACAAGDELTVIIVKNADTGAPGVTSRLQTLKVKIG